MSYPLVPPPVSDTGAYTIPRTLQRWLDINAISKLTRTQGYITLPSFSVSVDWKGYSDIVAAFNFEGPNNFSLTGFNIEPTPAPNYCLCVMWKDTGGNVKRYKLWKNVGEVMYFDVPDYDGQKIGKNFRFEVWSTNNTPAVQANPISIFTSVLGKVDYRWGQDFTLVSTDGLVDSFGSVNTIPTLPATVSLQYVGTNILPSSDYVDITSWPASVGIGTLVPSVNVAVVNAPSLGLSSGRTSVLSNGTLTSPALSGVSSGTVAMLLRIQSGSASGNILSMSGGPNINLAYDSSTHKLTAWDSCQVAVEQAKWYFVVLVPGTLGVYDLSGFLVGGSGSGSTAGDFNGITIGGSGNICIPEIIFWNNELPPFWNGIMSYFLVKYANAMSLPLIFPTNSSPVAN